MAYEVTIGIPVYNSEEYIRMTMDSALSQTFESIEYLILDDCGTDNTIEIIHEYQQKHYRGKDIRIVRQPQNGGIGRARNRIVEEAQGNYLFFLDADDTIMSYAIELLYRKMRLYNAEIVYGSYEKTEDFGGIIKSTPFTYPFMKFLNDDEFAERVYSDYGFLQANTWNMLIKKEIYFENNIRYKPVSFWEDFSFTMDLPTYVTRVVLLPDVTYFYYCHYGSLSHFDQRTHIDKSEIQDTLEAMASVKRNSERLKLKPYFHKRMYKVMMTHFYMACTILKDRRVTKPSFSMREIRDVMRSPLSVEETLKLKDWRIKNLILCLLGVLPPMMSVLIIWVMGKRKGLI